MRKLHCWNKFCWFIYYIFILYFLISFISNLTVMKILNWFCNSNFSLLTRPELELCRVPCWFSTFSVSQKSVFWFMLSNTVTVHVYLIMEINNPYFPRHDASKSSGLSFQERWYKDTNFFPSALCAWLLYQFDFIWNHALASRSPVLCFFSFIDFRGKCNIF